ncbi:hypothetical protein [Ornithinimicrobium flavum]|uniref:hypothetical protein n=2 Tax=Ornithinimicrobium flavum TaxID=1288636 RepID=UPI00106FD39B|nr:hypothetical protein [Ornithinimicrobium flavum]
MPAPAAREVLRAALVGVGLDEAAAAAIGDAAVVLGAVGRGRRVDPGDLSSAEARTAQGPGPDASGVPGQGGAGVTGSVGACLGEADVALAAMEALAQASMRLDAALVLTARSSRPRSGRRCWRSGTWPTRGSCR